MTDFDQQLCSDLQRICAKASIKWGSNGSLQRHLRSESEKVFDSIRLLEIRLRSLGAEETLTVYYWEDLLLTLWHQQSEDIPSCVEMIRAAATAEALQRYYQSK